MTANAMMERTAVPDGSCSVFFSSIRDTTGIAVGSQAKGATRRQTGHTRGADMSSATRYYVYNATDGVLASPDAMTNDEAAAFVLAFRQWYTRQGYYLTARRERRRPKDIQLKIIDEEPGA